MRLGMDVRGTVDDDMLAFGAQLGATDAVAGRDSIPQPESGYFDYSDLVRLRQRIEDAGLRLWAIENIPPRWYLKIMMGTPGRDEQIDNWCTSLKNMGKAGIPVLGYHFMVLTTWRTSVTTTGRGGAQVSSFDYDLINNGPEDEVEQITDDELWDNYTYFLKAVIPVAEQAGVKMGLHPDDPPVSPIAGVARIMRSHASLKRLTEIVPSDHNGLEFCQGTVSEMPENVIDAIDYFGPRNKIMYVHFRNVSGPVPSFQETFIDEGHVDMLEAMRAYNRAGFDGPMIDDHVPHMTGDTRYSFRARAFAMGYVKALIDAVNAGA